MRPATKQEVLISEFSDLAGSLVWHKWIKPFHSHTYDKEDIYNDAICGLLEVADQLEDVTDQRERGLIAWRGMKKSVRAAGYRDKWVKPHRVSNGFELLPIIDFGTTSDGITTLDFIPVDGGYGFFELYESLKTLIPDVALYIWLMRESGMLWREIAAELDMQNIGSARYLLFHEIEKAGITTSSDLVDWNPSRTLPATQ